MCYNNKCSQSSIMITKVGGGLVYMNNLYKKDVKQFISIFVKKLDIADYDEVRVKIEKYLKKK